MTGGGSRDFSAFDATRRAVRDLAGSGLLPSSRRGRDGSAHSGRHPLLRPLGTMMDGRLRNEEVARRIGHNMFLARRRAGHSQEELGNAARCTEPRSG